MNPSSNLLIIGPTGAGKSTLGQWLGPRLGLQLADLDTLIAARAGCSVTQIFASEGAAGFRAREAQALADHAMQHELLLVCGAGIVTRADNRARLQELGFVLWLDVPPARRARRLADDASRPLLQGAALETRLAAMDAERTAWYAQCADAHLSADAESAEQVGARALQLLAADWQRVSSAARSPA